MSEIFKYLSSKLHLIEKDINDWLLSKHNNSFPIPFSSVDIRHSGQKICPVDTNIFPAGFNNISIESEKIVIDEFKNLLKRLNPNFKNIALYPELHTRNTKYLENLCTIKKIIEQSGFNCFVIHENEEFGNQKYVDVSNFTINDKNIYCDKNLIDLVILNNDLTNGIPNFFQNIKTKIIPSILYGWNVRRKSTHFSKYSDLIDEFSKDFCIEPFFLKAEFRNCGNINFKDKKGLECIQLNADKMFHSLIEKYKNFSIKQKPYIYIKSNNGTYGMAVMTISRPEDIISINKKIRNKMNAGKSGVITSDVIIQEGIATIDKYNNKPSEALIYCANSKPISFLNRYNEKKDEYNNLNSDGMGFVEIANLNSLSQDQKMYFMVSSIANISATNEINKSL